MLLKWLKDAWNWIKGKLGRGPKPNPVTQLKLEIEMAKNARLTWTLPTERVSGGSLDPSEIAHVEINMSADQGMNFVVVGTVQPTSAQEFLMSDLDAGTWLFMARVVDTNGKASSGTVVTGTFDDTAPGDVVNLAVVFE